MTILVTGATGNVGRNVVRQLVAKGHDVRALTRRAQPGVFPDQVRVHEGDLTRPQTLPDALEGVEALFLFPVPATAEEVVGLAKKAGVRRIVVLSSGAVTTGFDNDFHLPVERAVEASGLEWTHVRPGEFAMNKLELWGPPIRAERVVREPFPDVAWFPVHEQDIADVAVLALTEDGHRGQAYTVNGPEFLSRRRQVELIAEAMGEEIRLEVVSPQEAREIYLAQGGFAADNADFLLGFETYGGDESDPSEMETFDSSALGPMPTAEEVTGRPARTFAQWARDHADEFRA
ncbi:SDR family oxidoreductase [Streptomyces rubradiris]|uniref:Nucleotide-diphosphate-sugar epimerase n=1 Tax=Streptomyces rubradiris TaxID=285531 RepID=A0ABQ3RIF8_STRRR|nr:NAD(P)H-binding protein [Streptomyces rubradiris]GHH21726.1 nucleotide-diphosphate-sugar epimerase [Streptomyces rubradiris]GHI55633.1 nucleotide-diphosphate-sugar epimerase [Streptomyces rubradiris]